MLKQKAYNKKCPFCGEKIKPIDEIYPKVTIDISRNKREEYSIDVCMEDDAAFCKVLTDKVGF